MNPLLTESNFHEPGHAPRQPFDAGDAFYALLIDTHRDLGDADSELLNARLVLLLANHIGDLGVLRQALRLARDGLPDTAADPVRGNAPATQPVRAVRES